MQHEPPTTDLEPQAQGLSQRQDSATSGTVSNQPVHQQQSVLTKQPSAQPGPNNQPASSGQQVEPAVNTALRPTEASTEALNLQGKTEGTLLDDTMQELQLRSQPFTGSSAEGELFADEVTFSQINEIKQAIIKGDTVLVLTGEEGAGKTTLLKQLTRNTGTRLQFFSVKGGEKYTTHNLFSGILDAWKLTPPADFEDSTNEMLRGLQANQERHTTVVLLLDDADLIPIKELHLLLATVQYFNGDEQLLRVILSVQPQFEAQLPQMLPRGLKLPYSAMQVEPMLASRAAPYIQLRLNQAGHFDEFPLSDKQVSAIANDASGYPGRINFLAAEALNDMFCPFTESQAQSSKSGFFSNLFKARTGAGAGTGKIGKVVAALLGVGLIIAGIYSTAFKDKSGSDEAFAGNQGGNPSTSNLSAENRNAADSTTANNSEFKTVETRPVVTKPANVANENVADSTTAGNTRLEQVSAAGATASDNVASDNKTGADAVSANSVAANANANSAAGATSADNGTTTAAQNNQGATSQAELKAAASELSAALGKAQSTNPQQSTATTDSAAADTAESRAQAANASTKQATESTTAANQTNQTDATSPAADSNATTSTDVAAASTTDSQADSQADSTANSAADAAAKQEATDNTSDTDAEVPAATPTTTDEQAAEVAGTETKAEADPPATGDNVDGLESPNWVLLQEADQFTVQMSASTDRADITRFLRAAELEKPISIYSFKRGETTWYALVQGLYPNLGEARTAIKGMNKAAVKNQPWIRKIGSIQDSVKQ